MPLLLRGGEVVRGCATSRKVGVSVPDAVITILHCLNPSGTEVNSTSNRNDYKEYLLVVKAVGA
jgi:hypothetical protein